MDRPGFDVKNSAPGKSVTQGAKTVPKRGRRAKPMALLAPLRLACQAKASQISADNFDSVKINVYIYNMYMYIYIYNTQI